METMEAIASRKSTRSFCPDQIPDDVLSTILMAGCAAPVASGQYDSLHITVIQNKQILDKIAVSVAKMLNRDQPVSFGAPTIVLVSSTGPHFPGIDFANAGCILENMMIAATDQGVDSVLWGGAGVVAEADAELRKALAIPDGFHPVLCVALGYATVPNEPAKAHKIAMNRA